MALYDRSKTEWPQSQIGIWFIQYAIIPAYEILKNFILFVGSHLLPQIKHSHLFLVYCLVWRVGGGGRPTLTESGVLGSLPLSSSSPDKTETTILPLLIFPIFVLLQQSSNRTLSWKAEKRPYLCLLHSFLDLLLARQPATTNRNKLKRIGAKSLIRKGLAVDNPRQNMISEA